MPALQRAIRPEAPRPMIGLSARHLSVMTHFYGGHFQMPTITMSVPTHPPMPDNPRALEAYTEVNDAIVGLRPMRVVMMAYVRYALARYAGKVTHTSQALQLDRR